MSINTTKIILKTVFSWILTQFGGTYLRLVDFQVPRKSLSKDHAEHKINTFLREFYVVIMDKVQLF